MRKVLLDHGEIILVKSPNHGCAELRNEICRYLARSRGISVDPSQVIVGSGSEYLYGLIAQLLGERKRFARPIRRSGRYMRRWGSHAIRFR